VLVLHFLDDNGNKLSLLKGIAERLVSGATFVMLDITGNKNQIQQNLKVLRLLLPSGLDKEQINTRLNRIENELFPVSEERLSELCEEAGFEPPLRFFQSSIYMGWLMKKK
jgi:tRNA (cmo5U34)-methyltransferase